MTISKRGCRLKGRRGQSTARDLLTERDWTCDDLSCGRASADLIATDPHGVTWCVEVKDHASVQLRAWRKQAIGQANARRLPWLLMAHLDGSAYWLVLGQARQPELWKQRNEQS